MRQGLILLLLLCLTGCGRGLPQPREMGEIALMRTMAVDAGENGGIRVTVSSGEEEGQTCSAQRATVAGACQAVRAQGENAVFLGHVERLLLGEGLCAAGGVIPTLQYFSRDEELGLGAQVWLVRGEAQQEAAFAGTSGLKRTAGEVLGDLVEDGCTFVPVVGGGYGVLSAGGLQGVLTGEEALGLELLQGHALEELVELENGAVEVDSATLTCIPVAQGARIVGLELDLRLTTHLEEAQSVELDPYYYKEAVAAQAEQWVKAAVERAQREGLDFPGLCRRAGASRPELWKEIRSQREAQFSDWTISVRCTATITDRRR